MNTREAPVVDLERYAEDDLLRLEMRVAQRADELSQQSGGIRGRDLQHWLQAEREVLEWCPRVAGRM